MEYIVGVAVIAGVIYFIFSRSKKSQEIEVHDTHKPGNPPSRRQKEICERLGITLSPTTSRRDVHFLIEEARKDPKLDAIYKEYEAEKEALVEQEEREEYGDELYEEMKKWESLCVPGSQYLIVYKKGKSLNADIIEFESVDIEGDNKFRLKIDGLLPKKHKESGTDEYLEWEKEISLKPSQILEVEKLSPEIDMFDIPAYEQAKTEAKKRESDHVASNN